MKSRLVLLILCGVLLLSEIIVPALAGELYIIKVCTDTNPSQALAGVSIYLDGVYPWTFKGTTQIEPGCSGYCVPTLLISGVSGKHTVYGSWRDPSGQAWTGKRQTPSISSSPSSQQQQILYLKQGNGYPWA